MTLVPKTESEVCATLFHPKALASRSNWKENVPS